MKFVFEQIRNGGDRNFGYLLGDREAGVAAVVDPGYEPGAILERADAQGLEIGAIVNTHGHADHTAGNDAVREHTTAPLVAHVDAAAGPDVPLEDGDTLEVGAFTLEFLHTPGHAHDHLVVHVPEHRVAITGDLLFVGKIGGTSGEEDARRELESLERVLGELPDETTVWPGHDYGCRPSSTIGLERATNPFLLCDGVDAFLELKRTWSTFKVERGLM